MKRIGWCGLLIVMFCAVVALTWVKQSAAVTDLDVDWTHYGNDLGNMRYQNLDQINPTNVGRLRPAWVFHTGVIDPQASLEVSPIVVEGVMFITTGHDDVFALDAATGHKLWEHHPHLLAPLAKLQLCCGEVNRGVAFGNGRVYSARVDGVLEALDAQTGHTVWQRVVVDFRDRYTLTMAPQFVNGFVIVGSSGGEYKARGQVMAFDASTGNEVWRTFTTGPGLGWAGDSWKHGGAHVWMTPAVDPSLGLLYINTGNAGNDINGRLRAGNNLFSSSIVALDVTTGHPRWAFQEVHHDLWDYDSAQPAILFTLRKNGQELPALGECSKNGNYYILDRRSGVPLYPVREIRVPTDPDWQNASPTQPLSSVEPLTPLDFVPGTIDFSKLPHDVKLGKFYEPPHEQKLLINPGDDGGCEFPPAAFSPRTQFVYYGARYEPALYQTPRSNEGPNDKGLFLGSKFAEVVPGVRDFGIFGATDTTTGKVAWKIIVPQPAKSGLLVAGDLVFFGEGNGKFHAADSRTGRILFTFDGTSLPHGGGAQAAPIAYVCAGGKEFIANAFGGNSADAQFAPNPTGDAVVAFTLR
ncbi:MAG: PQQ-binding-like beta-propeller repeat protein [Candidatus Eremiobacteraeota bacterium]|nr:PQQ-binding-like beta-propeller repeat protein [Candidatus Eremiobacteraeota bacterium]